MTRTFRRSGSIVSAAALVGLALAAWSLAPATAAAEWGDLIGQFVYDGKPPAPKKIDVNKDVETFGKLGLVDESLLVESSVTAVVQVQGKVKARLEVSPDIAASELEQLALADPAVVRAVEGREVRRVIVREPSLVNVVVRSAFIRNIIIPDRFLEQKRLERLAIENKLTSEALTLTAETEAEVAEHMGIALGDLHQIFSQVSFVNVVALDELLSVGGEKGDKLSLVDTLEDTKAEDPVQAFESEETKYLLARAINTLPEREKIVVTLYYYEGLTLAEIGSVLGVTESRICQMHTKAVLQMRSKLTEQHDDD